ncbi:MAG: hypothetical protein ABI723_22230 [Bacteroidia bacterium]
MKNIEVIDNNFHDTELGEPYLILSEKITQLKKLKEINAALLFFPINILLLDSVHYGGSFVMPFTNLPQYYSNGHSETIWDSTDTELYSQSSNMILLIFLMLKNNIPKDYYFDNPLLSSFLKENKTADFKNLYSLQANDSFRIYYPGKEVAAAGKVKKHLPYGEVKFFNLKGEVSEERFYQNGEPKGKWKYYFSEGKCYREIDFTNRDTIHLKEYDKYAKKILDVKWINNITNNEDHFIARIWKREGNNYNYYPDGMSMLKSIKKDEEGYVSNVDENN